VQHFYPAAGYRAWSAGENLLWATSGITAQQALRLWMGSPGHRANILNGRWREIGISARSFAAAPGTYHGGAVTIITTDFGARGRQACGLALGHRDLAKDPWLDAVEDLVQALAGGGDAVVPQADHRAIGIGLLRQEIGDAEGQLLRPARVVHVGRGNALHP